MRNYTRLFGNTSQRALLIVFSLVLLSSHLVFLGPIGSQKVSADPIYPELISQNTVGEPGNQNSSKSILSDDGRYVVFMSSASNLDNQSDGSEQIYLRDRQENTTRMVSVNSAGEPQNGDTLRLTGLSGDGRYVFFATSSTNIDPRASGNIYPFRHDTMTGETELIGLDENDDPVSSDWRVSSSYDGSIVAFAGFRSPSQNLAILFVRDLVSGTVLKIVEQSNWAYLNGDGSKVLYTTTVTNDWVTEVADIAANSTMRIDLRENGQNSPEEFDFEVPMGLSTDGRYAFLLTYDPEFSSQTVMECQFHGCTYRIDVTNGLIQVVRANVDGGYVYPEFIPEALSNDGKKFVYHQNDDEVTGLFFADIEEDVAYRVGYGPNWAVPSTPAGESSISGNGDLFSFVSGSENFGIPANCVINTEGGQTIGQCEHVYVATTGQNPNDPSDQTSPALLTPVWSQNPKPVTDSATLTVPAIDEEGGSGIAGGEYFIGDEDPGQDNGIAMDWDGTNLTTTFGTDLPAGTYKINVRAVDNAGNWSDTVVTELVVVVEDSDNTPPVLSNLDANYVMWRYFFPSTRNFTVGATDALSGVAGGEFYIDTDPGEGNGTPLTLSDSTLSGTVPVNAPYGWHQLHVRARDNAGNWSDTVSQWFFIGIF